MASSLVHASRLMGGWAVDISDRSMADAALARCRTQIAGAELEVRHTQWGVQVRTDSSTAVALLTAEAPAPLAA